MTGLTTDLVPEILAACNAGAASASAALSQCFEQDFSISPGTPQAFRASDIPATWQGAGLAMMFVVQGEAAILFVTRASGLLPDWCQQPSADQTMALDLLVEELAQNFLPSGVTVDEVATRYFPDFAHTLQEAETSDLCVIPWDFADGNKTSPALLLWPVANYRQLLQSSQSTSEDALLTAPDNSRADAAASPYVSSSTVAAHLQDIEEALLSMPPYIRSLLRIKVQLAVTLAQTSYPVKKILGLAPGSIIQFDKSCDDALELRVGQKCIGVGEAVKSGEKYALRLTSMVLPEERFVPLGKQPRRVG